MPPRSKTTTPSADEQAVASHRTRPAGQQELDVLAQNVAGFRLIQQMSMDQMIFLFEHELPLDMDPVKRAELRAELLTTFKGLAAIADVARDHRDMNVLRAAGNSTATNDARAKAAAHTWRAEAKQASGK